MARATEKSGSEMQAMTQRMESDARLMKFLAELTAFFLPITAIGVSRQRALLNGSRPVADVIADSPQLGFLRDHSTRQRAHTGIW